MTRAQVVTHFLIESDLRAMNNAQQAEAMMRLYDLAFTHGVEVTLRQTPDKVQDVIDAR